jgi:hypothetical protein
MAERLSIIIDSMHLSTVAASLIKLASDYPLHITISGTLAECVAREQEILKLLYPIKPWFTFGVGMNLQDFAKDPTFYAVKLHDFGRRGGE